MTQPLVLVVDDSAAMRRMLVRTLAMAGVEEDRIATAGDGLEALKELEKHRPRLLLTDVTMPNMDGVDLLRAIQRRGWNEAMRIVSCTSVSSSRTLLELVRLGSELVIRKPFDRQQVAEQLRELLTPAQAEEPTPVEPPATGDPIDEVVATVMERMTFSFTERIEPGTPMPDPTKRLHCRAKIPMEGLGTIDVWATSGDARSIAAALTGEAASDDDVAGLDALAEIANTIAGAWQQALVDRGDQEAAQAELHPPEISVHEPGKLPLDRVKSYLLDGAGFLHVEAVDERASAYPAA